MKIKTNYKITDHIQNNKRQLRDAVDEAMIAIRKYNKEFNCIYRRKNAVVQVDEENGLKKIRPVTRDEMYSLKCRVANWYNRSADGELYDAHPDSKIGPILLASPDEELPELETIHYGPIIGKNGDLITEDGYHKDHKIIVSLKPGFQVPQLPTVISDSELAAAKHFLRHELLDGFPFVGQSDEAHTIAALIQPFVRLYFDGPTPLHLVMAPSPGTGKTYLANIISIVTTGSMVAAQTLPRDEDELRKGLVAALAAGPNIMLFDNADTNVKIDSASLSSILTTEEFTGRVLGYSKMITLINKALWLMTANNPQVSNEIARRTISIKLDAKCERPYERSNYRHTDLIKWTFDHRAEIIYAILILVKNWLSQGAVPFQGKVLGSFVDYSLKIGGILQSCGISGFLENQHELYAFADSETKEWEYFVNAWFERHGFTPVKPSQLLDLCHQHELLADVTGFGVIRSQHTYLGKALIRMEGRIFGKFCIKVMRSGRTHGNQYVLAPIAVPKLSDQLILAPSTELEHQDNLDNIDNLLTIHARESSSK